MSKVEPSNKLEKIMDTFSKNQLRLIMKNVGAIQLTEGCNSACPDCGLGAKPGVSDYIPFSTLEKLFTKFGEELSNNRIMLYHASEPFDYQDGEFFYPDVHDLYEKKVGRTTSIITSIPKGKEKEILDYVINKNYLKNFRSPFINSLSITKLNYSRVEKAIHEMIPELRSKNQMIIPSKYTKLLCSYSATFGTNIEWTSHPKGNRNVLINEQEIFDILSIKNRKSFFLNGLGPISTLEREEPEYDETNSYLHFSLKHSRRPTKKEHTRIMRKSDEQRANRNKYFSISQEESKNKKDSLHVIQLSNGDYLASESTPVSINTLFCCLQFNYNSEKYSGNFKHGVQIRDFRGGENIHSEKLGLNNMNDLSEKSISCIHGVIITPSGIFNLQTRKPTTKYPFGLKITPIEPNNFEVAKYENLLGFEKPPYQLLTNIGSSSKL